MSDLANLAGRVELLTEQLRVYKKKKGGKKKPKGYKPGRGHFEESKHPRGPGGKFKDKPDEFGKPSSSKSVLSIGHSQNGKPSGSAFTSYIGHDTTSGPYSSLGPHRRLHDRIAKETLGGHPKTRLSSIEQSAIRRYTSSDYRPINARLRKVEQSVYGLGPKEDLLDETIDEIVSDLDSAFKKVRLSEGLVTYRGLSGEGWKKLKAAGLKPGKVFTDMGFYSTTSDISFANSWRSKGAGMLIAVRIPKGSKALTLGTLSSLAKESEVLIARGAKFKVLRIKGKQMVVQLIKTGAKSSRTIKFEGDAVAFDDLLNQIRVLKLDLRLEILRQRVRAVEKKRRSRKPRGGYHPNTGHFKPQEHPRGAGGKFKDVPGKGNDAPKAPQFRTQSHFGPHPKPDYEMPPKPVIPRGGVKEIEPVNSPFKPAPTPLKPDPTTMPSDHALSYNDQKPLPNVHGSAKIMEGEDGFNDDLVLEALNMDGHYNTPTGMKPTPSQLGWDDELGIKAPSGIVSLPAKPKTFLGMPKPDKAPDYVLTANDPEFNPSYGLKYHYNTPDGVAPSKFQIKEWQQAKDNGAIPGLGPAAGKPYVPSPKTGKLDEFGDDIADSNWKKAPSKVGHSSSNTPSDKEFTSYSSSSNQMAIHGRISKSSFQEHLYTNDMEVAVRAYTTSSYRPVNARLRKVDQSKAGTGAKEMSTQAINKVVSGLDELFKNVKLSEGMVTYRGMGGPGWEKLKAVVKPGKVFTDLGFFSTSTRKNFSAGWQHGGVLMAIRIPKGMAALPIANKSSHSVEHEVLIARGAKFKVLRYDSSKQHVVLQLMKTGSKSSKTLKYLYED